MAQFLGMDTEAGTATAHSLRTHEAAVRHAAQQVEDAAAKVQWDGNDAQNFHVHLTQDAVGECTSLALGMSILAQRLEREAMQQDQASRSPFGYFGPSGVPALAQGPAIKHPRPMGQPIAPHLIDGHTLLAWGLFGASVWYSAGIGALIGFQPGYTTKPSTITSITKYPPSKGAQSISDLVLDNNEARGFAGGGKNRENIRIQELRTASGENTWIVQIPPTQAGLDQFDSWTGTQPNSRDWASNFYMEFGIDVTAMVNVRQAMEAAGVPKGANVAIVGHSQGGDIAAALASEPSFNGPGGYNVTNVVTLGSPSKSFPPSQTSTITSKIYHEIGPSNPNPHVHRTSFTPMPFASDPVATLDFGSADSPQVRAIALTPNKDHHASAEYGDVYAAHDSVRINPVSGEFDAHYGYWGTIHEQEDSDPGLIALKNDLDGIYIGDDVTVVSDTNVQMVRQQETPKH